MTKILWVQKERKKEGRKEGRKEENKQDVGRDWELHELSHLLPQLVLHCSEYKLTDHFLFILKGRVVCKSKFLINATSFNLKYYFSDHKVTFWWCNINIDISEIQCRNSKSSVISEDYLRQSLLIVAENSHIYFALFLPCIFTNKYAFIKIRSSLATCLFTCFT